MKGMSHNPGLPKVVVLLGPTVSGKTAWSLEFAKKFNGEVISADSRQVYKKMDIGTAKVPGRWRWKANWRGLRHSYFVGDIAHHLVDFLDPGEVFTVAQFRDHAIKYIKLAYKNERVPFVVGGTGLYISALVDNLYIPRIAPNLKLRRSLSEKSSEHLMHLLRTLDEEAADTIDPNNKRRIVRALEVCILSGEPFSQQQKKGEPMFEFLQIGIDVPREELYQRIDMRVDDMMRRGLLSEIENLLRQKYSWDLPSMSGIGYRQFKGYFDGTVTKRECVENLKKDSHRFARRQITWFKRDDRIQWCKTMDEAQALVAKFLSV